MIYDRLTARSMTCLALFGVSIILLKFFHPGACTHLYDCSLVCGSRYITFSGLPGAGMDREALSLLSELLLAGLISAAMVHIPLRFSRRALFQRIIELRTLLRATEERLQGTVADLQRSNDALAAAQERLVATDALASLGQLTAGIAHEIRNPMNFVNNFAESTVDIVDELRDELARIRTAASGPTNDRITPLLEELVTSAQKIREHGKRVDGIVRSMLLHSHGKAGQVETVLLNEFLDQYVTLAFHGMRAQIPDFSITIEKDYDPEVHTVPIIRQDMARVFVNLLNNAFQAVDEARKNKGTSFEPLVRIRTMRKGTRTLIIFEDNGPGVPDQFRARIFEPFFTTKEHGIGTGLGLALSYQCIVQGHGGDLRYEESALGGAAFVIDLPH